MVQSGAYGVGISRHRLGFQGLRVIEGRHLCRYRPPDIVLNPYLLDFAGGLVQDSEGLGRPGKNALSQRLFLGRGALIPSRVRRLFLREGLGGRR